MFSKEIDKKILEAEKIINEIEVIKKKKSSVEKGFNKLNKDFNKKTINEEKYKSQLKKEFKDGKTIKEDKSAKKLNELFQDLRGVNRSICDLFEISKKIKEEEINLDDVKAFVKRLKKGQKGEEEKIKYSTYSYNFLGKYGNLLFNKISVKLARKYPDYFKGLYKNLRMANIRVFSNTYINLGIFMSCAIFFLAFLLGFLLFKISLLGMVQSLVLAILVFFIVAIGFYYYPKVIVDTRRREIKNDLPFAILHMAAVAGSGAKLSDIFGMLLRSDEYKALSGEIKRIMNYVNLFGYNLTTALKSVGATTPSKEFKELLNGMVGNVESGGNIKSFLKNKAEDTLMRYRLDRKKYVETLSTYTDIYTAILIAAPLLFVIVLVLVSIVGDNLGGLEIGFIEKMGTFIVVPALNIGFIIFMNIVQPDI